MELEEAEEVRYEDSAPSALFSTMFEKMRVKVGDDPRTVLSKTLSYVLRHGAKDLELDMNEDGYVTVADLLALEMFFKGVKLEDLQDTVEQSNRDKERYELTNDGSEWLIRATGKHTISDMKPADRVRKERRPRGGPSGTSGRQRNVPQLSEDEFCQRWRLDRLARLRLSDLPPSSRQLAMQRFSPTPEVPQCDYPKVFVAFCKRFRGKGKDDDGGVDFDDGQDDDWATSEFYTGKGKAASRGGGKSKKGSKGRGWEEDWSKSRGWEDDRGKGRGWDDAQSGHQWANDGAKPRNGWNGAAERELERSQIHGDYYGTVSSLFPSPGASPRTSEQGVGNSVASTAVTGMLPPAMNLHHAQASNRQVGSRMELHGWPSQHPLSQPPVAPPPPAYPPQGVLSQAQWAPPPPMHAPQAHVHNQQSSNWPPQQYAAQSYHGGRCHGSGCHQGGAPQHYAGDTYAGNLQHHHQPYNNDAFQGGAWNNSRAPEGARVGHCF